MALQKMNFHQEMENSEANKVLTRRGKKEYVWIDTRVGSEREWCPRGGRSISFAWFRLFGLSQCPPILHTHLLAKIDSSEEAYEQVDSAPF